MADTTLLEALKQPHAVIKSWRDQGKPLDLSGEDLDALRIWDATGGENYADFTLSRATLRDHQWIDSLENAQCEGTDFSGSTISGIKGADLRGAKLDNCTVRDTKAPGTQFDAHTSFVDAIFRQVDLTGATGLDTERFKHEVLKAENVTLPDGTSWQKPPPT